MSTLCLGVAAAIAASQPAACGEASAWRRIATDTDRDRLHQARAGWTAALAQSGSTLRGDPMFDPDRALDHPLPPAGRYRCRFVKFGTTGVATREWHRCDIAEGRLVAADGPQRPTGRLFADTAGRAVFLGTLLLGDETRPIRYGRDDRRDMAGIVERVDTARWRVTLPQPGFESTLDLLELVPDA